MANIAFLETRLIDDHTYIDLCNIDGQLTTFLMKKKAEPNYFEAVKIESGNTMDTIHLEKESPTQE